METGTVADYSFSGENYRYSWPIGFYTGAIRMELTMNDCKNCEICPDCLKEFAPDLWLVYYEQYYSAVKKLLRARNRKQLLIPFTFLLAQYLEIWIKVIGSNFSQGNGIDIRAKEIRGHNLLDIYDKVFDVIDLEERHVLQEYLDYVRDLIEYFCGITIDDGVSLSEATRFPTTSKGNSSLNYCIFHVLSDECNKMDYTTYFRNAEDLLYLTYDIYDGIYALRRGID